MQRFDMKKYLKRHSLFFSNISDKNNCALVGSGKLGACVYQNKNEICLQITNVDASPQSQMSSGIVVVKRTENDFLNAKLDIYNGVLYLNFKNGDVYKIFGGKGDELLFVESKCSSIEKTEIFLRTWDTSNNKKKSFRWEKMVKCPNDWDEFNFQAKDLKLFVSRGSNSGLGVQGIDEFEDVADETCFGYTLGISVDCDGAKVIDDKIIMNNNSFFLKIANPSRLSLNDVSKCKDTFSKCCKMLDIKYDHILSDYSKFWNDFFNKSFVISHSNNDDYMENMYYISRYILACGMMGKMPMHFICGNFRSNGDNDVLWGVAYWWYNQRCLYGGMMANGSVEFLKTQLDLYQKNIDKIRADTRVKFLNSKGLVVPETMCWDGRRTFSDNAVGVPPVTEYINCTGLEIALKMYEYAKFTKNEVYLVEVFLPFAKSCVDFYTSSILKKDAHGKYFIPKGISNARESYVKIKNPITDIAGLKAILPKMIKIEEDLKNESYYLSEILSNLPDFQLGGMPKRLLAGSDSLDYERTNWDDPCLEVVYPFNLVYCGTPYYNEMINNYFYRIGRYDIIDIISWDNASIWASRLGLNDEVVKNIEFTIAKTQKHCNGLGSDGNCKYEYLGNIITALNESLLQSFNGIIKVFPTVCLNKKDYVSAFKLYAQGGFIVESCFDYSKLEAKYVFINSLFGGKLKIYNPYGKGRYACVKIGDVLLEFNDEIIEVDSDIGDEILIYKKNACSNDLVFQFDEIDNNAPKKFQFGTYLVKLGN